MKNYTEEELKEKFEQISNYYKSLYEREEKPKVYMLGGQPGAGKSGLERMINIKGNYIPISGDDYRKDHPQYKQFNRIYGKDASIHTQQWAGEMVEKLVKEMRNEKYNIILEGTLRTSEIPIKEAEEFKKAGYSTELNIVVVKPEKSFLGTLQRYEKMIADGFTPRMTPKEHHDLVVKNIPDNIEKIYSSKVFDEIKLYNRENRLLYSQKETPDKNPKEVLETEFKRKWDKEEFQEYKKDFQKVIVMMEKRHASNEEIENTKNEMDKIVGNISKNLKKELKKKKEKDFER